ncbi:phage tail protein, partial [Escherichia coli]|nr:phage tail protein [Escherichia coli]
MTSKYEVTKGMTFAVSGAPVTAEDFNSSTFPGAGVTWLEAA